MLPPSLLKPVTLTTSATEASQAFDLRTLHAHTTILVAELRKLDKEYVSFRDKHSDCDTELKRLQAENRKLMEENAYLKMEV